MPCSTRRVLLVDSEDAAGQEADDKS